MSQRGEIRNPQYAEQIRDYSGLRWNKITPTDIDGIVELKDMGYALWELKHGAAAVERGQRLALERLSKDLAKAGKKVLCMIARHRNPPPEHIDGANASVAEVYRQPKGRPAYWAPPNRTLTVKEAIDLFATHNRIPVDR